MLLRIFEDFGFGKDTRASRNQRHRTFGEIVRHVECSMLFQKPGPPESRCLWGWILVTGRSITRTKKVKKLVLLFLLL